MNKTFSRFALLLACLAAQSAVSQSATPGFRIRVSDRFIYPVKLKAKFEERSMPTDLDEKSVTVDAAIDSIAAYHFTPRYDMSGEAKY